MAKTPVAFSSEVGTKPTSTRQALLEAAIAELTSRPEAEFRVENILAATGASFSSLYHHFGNREGLIIEAQIAVFKSPIAQDLVPFTAAAAKISNAEELKEVLAVAVSAASRAENAKARAAQLAILSAANSRPLLAEAIAKEQAEVTSQIAAAFDGLSERGVIDPQVDTRLIGQYMQATILGQSVLDLGAGPLDLTAYQDLLLKTLLALIWPTGAH